MQSWRPNGLLKAILIWTAITGLMIYLPFIRGLMDGSDYRWGNAFWGIQLNGSGVGGDYWVLPLQTALVIAVLLLGWRGAKAPFHWLLLLWHLPFSIGVTSTALRFPDDFRFRGDTMGVDFSLAWLGPLLFGGFALLSLIWVTRDLRRNQPREITPLRRANHILLAIMLALLPVQFFLLRFGEQHGPNDKIGVLLTMLQWIGLNIAIATSGSKKVEAGHV